MKLHSNPIFLKPYTKFLSKYLILYAVFMCFLAPRSTWACTFDGYSTDHYIAFFNPYTATYGDSSFVACFLDEGYINSQSYYLPTPTYTQNLAEWASYTQNKATTTDIQSLIYTKNTVFFEQLLSQAKQGKTANAKNSFENFLLQKKDIAAITYLILAKKAESQTQPLDPWADPPQQRDSVLIAKLLQEATQQAKTNPNPFLKLRYAFQAVKMAFYLNKPQTFFDTYSAVFEPLISQNTNNPYCIALAAGYAGGMYIQQKKYDLAALNYAQLFLNSPENRYLAVQNFNFEPQIIEKALQNAKDPKLKLTLLLLADIDPHNGPKFTLQYLQKMYEIDPNSPELMVATARKINEIERHFLSPYLTANLNAESKMVNYPYNLPRTFDIDTQNHENKQEASGIWQWISNIWNNLMNLFTTTKATTTNPQTTEQGNDSEMQNEISVEEEQGDYSPKPPVVNDWAMDGTNFITELQKFTQKIAESGKVQKTDFWYAAAAYLSYLLKNEANTYKLLEKINTQSPEITHQKNIITALIHTQKGNTDAAAEQIFYTAIQGFSQEQQTNQTNKENTEPDLYQSKYSLFNCFLVKLAQNYLSNNNLPKAILCFEKAKQISAAYTLTDIYATQTQLDQFYALLTNANKSAFEKFLIQKTIFTPELITDVQGTKFLRTNEAQKALQKFEKLPISYWKTAETKKYYDQSGSLLYEEGVENHIIFETTTETNLNNTLPPTATQYNKLTFAKKVIQLQQQNTPESYLQIGNLHGNTPFWGYCGNLWKGNLVYSIHDFAQNMGNIHTLAYPLNVPTAIQNFLKLHTQFTENEYGVRKLAVSYYQQAIQKGANPELTAECAMLSNFATKNPYASFNPNYYKELYFSSKEDSIKQTTQALLFDTAYLAQIKNYKNTQFFKHVIDQCPTFIDF